MIKDPEALKRFEDRFLKDTAHLSYEQSLRIFESMWNEGVELGVPPPDVPLEGIEKDIKLAKVLNSCSKTFSPE